MACANSAGRAHVERHEAARAAWTSAQSVSKRSDASKWGSAAGLSAAGMAVRAPGIRMMM
jgi:hypothetical protein